MKKMTKVRLFYMIICVFILIGCAGSSEKVDIPGSGANHSEEATKKMIEADRTIDDTYYVADIYGILMLCKEEDLKYKEYIQLLKGDSKMVERAMKDLRDMEQTPAVMNAIGVGYMRLDQCEKASEILSRALEMADDAASICILNNLGNVRLLETDDIINNTIAQEYDRAIAKASDPIDRIILQTNRLEYGPLIYLDDDDWEEAMADEIDRTLKEEETLLGSNQIAGMYNYLTLARYDLGGMGVENYGRALKINDEQFRYKAVEIVVYSGLRERYYIAGDYKKALEYADKRIEAGMRFLSETDQDQALAYLRKGFILVKEKRYDEAIQCMGPLLELEDYEPDQKALACLKSGEAYYGKGDFSKAEKMVEKAYDFFCRYEKELGYDDWDIREMLESYDEEDHYEGNPEYMQWVRDQLQG